MSAKDSFLLVLQFNPKLQQTHEKEKKKTTIQEVDSIRPCAQKICPFELIICEQIAMTLINIGFSFPATGSEW